MHSGREEYRLGSRTVRTCLQNLIQEARTCAQTSIRVSETEERVLGCAAMLTAFSVMNAISEAFTKCRNNTTNIAHFVNEMGCTDSWLLRSSSSPPCAHVLKEIRNGLVHAMKLPQEPWVVLVKDNTIAQVCRQDSAPGNQCIISVKEFIDAVERTANRLVDENPDKLLDPKGKKPFAPVCHVSIPGGEEGVISTAASSAKVK